MEEVTTEEVIDKLELFISKFGKVDQFGWCNLESIRADAGSQFLSEEFKDYCATRGINLSIAAPEHQEMNGLSEVTWRQIRTIAHSLMVFARVDDSFMHHALIYAAHVIFPALPLRDLVNEKGAQATPTELMTLRKARVSKIRTLFCPCIVKKHTAQYQQQNLNMRHQLQKGFRGIFIGFPDVQAGYEVYVPRTRSIVSSADVIFEESFSSAIAYRMKPYHEALSLRPGVMCTPHVTSIEK